MAAFLGVDLLASRYVLQGLFQGQPFAVEILIATCFIVLNFYGVFMLASHLIGWVALVRERAKRIRPDSPPSTRIAYVMPIYNEDPARVAAGVDCMWRSAKESGLDACCDFFVLSDSPAEEQRERETAALQSLATNFRNPTAESGRLFILTRSDRQDFKAGNIAHFLERFGEHYDFFLALDADSVMLGWRVRELVLRMEREPDIGILQAAVVPIRGRTLFAQVWHFGLWRTAPLFVAGLSWLMERRSVYWGHNALIRTRSFMKYCRLPALPGDKPFGGRIMSQDIVEAALMSRAGMAVVWDIGIGGSYDETPATVLHYAKRDHRWCQGNFQHFWIMISKGMPWPFRAYFAYGIMAYASSLVLLILVGLGFGHAVGTYDADEIRLVPWMLIGVIPVLQLIPKALGLAYWFDPSEGWPRRISSFVFDIVASSLLFPLLLYLHSKFVVTILAGKSMSWDCQERDPDSSISWATAARAFWLPTIVGVVLVTASAIAVPTFLVHSFLLLISLVFSIPLAVLSSHPRVSAYTRQRGWFTPPLKADDLTALRRAGLVI